VLTISTIIAPKFVERHYIRIIMSTKTATGNARAIVASNDGGVIRLQRCANVFIALGLGNDYAVVEPPELSTVYTDNVIPFGKVS
jgi:hypothetical protein